MSEQVPPQARARRRPWYAIAVVLLAATAFAGWARSGLLDLPSVPSDLTLAQSGLGDLANLKLVDEVIWGRSDPMVLRRTPMLRDAAQAVQDGINCVNRGDAEGGLARMRNGILVAPDNLALANAYRMVVFSLQRNFLRDAWAKGMLTPQFPPWLARQPIAFFEELNRSKPGREVQLSMALSWVDQMLLFPALEIKAPSSVEAVRILTAQLEGKDPGAAGYVPALFARGLNHLHRPSRLVWPETTKTPADAAAQDIGRCIAIGRRLNLGSERLQATLAIALGDAYIKAGRNSAARSWWQIAQNICRADDVQQSIRRRFAWRDEEMLDRLEEELDRGRSELDRPMTDLSMMWN